MNKDFRDSLHEYRKKNNLSQKDIAIELGVTRLTIIRWEQHKNKLTPRTTEKILKLLKEDIKFCPCCHRKITEMELK